MSTCPRLMRMLIAAALIASLSTYAAAQSCDPCDANCDTLHDANDVGPFVSLLLTSSAGCSPCAADLNADLSVDGADIQPFLNCLLAPPPTGACCTSPATCQLTTQVQCAGLWLGAGTACQGGGCPAGNLTAHRPQHGSAYFPFTRTAVAEADEESPTAGPGIRINQPGDADPQGEDDLIEVVVSVSPPAVPVALRRSGPMLRVWTTRSKAAGTEITFSGDRSNALPTVSGGATLWVEWAAAQHGTADLRLEPAAAGYALDVLRFHTFGAIVIALGGEGQIPSVPVDPNHGTFVTGIDLYHQGYDVFIHSESDVPPAGTGPAYDEVVDAVRNRMVNRVAIFGYSHGGGSTYFLADRLDVDRAGIGTFTIAATSYVDGVRNNSDIDVAQEQRRPPASGYHANQYQVGTPADFFLDGGPVPNSDPPPTGLNVETTSWGAGATHFIIDDYAQVKSFIETNFAARMAP